mgnify:CR=1 FL=1
MLVEKPSGITIHNDPGRDLSSQLAGYLQTYDMMGLDPQFGLHAVHRLDRETSGLVLLAGRHDVFEFLSEQFAEGLVQKKYLAVVHGTVPITPGDQWQQWTQPLARKAGGRSHIQGKGKRVACTTRFRALRHSRHYTLLICILVTGRMHQIRRHAALAGHPILGDLRYGSKRACRYLAEKYPTIRYLIGHSEYRRFEGHTLWRELDPNYRTEKVDPGDRFMAAVRAGVAELGLSGPPA